MALIFILLYAPIVTLVVLSFNASKTRAKWGGFTLHWYRSLFANTEIMNALYTTVNHCASCLCDCNHPWNACVHRHQQHVKKKPDAFHGYYEHPDAER